MSKQSQKTIVVFGAGRIGRSFIAPLFIQEGYTCNFIDADKNLVEKLNQKGTYEVHIRDKQKAVLRISNYKAFHITEKETITELLAGASLAAVSSGQKALPSIAGFIADGLLRRMNYHGMYPLDIIMAENLREAGSFMRKQIAEHLPATFPLDNMAGLVETSIGKMVPLLTEEDTLSDPLMLAAESYNTLILDAEGFKNPVPKVHGLAPKTNMKAWVDRKLFIHNLGHVALAYHTFHQNPILDFTWQALEIFEIKRNVRMCMKESAYCLRNMHPGIFTEEDLDTHIDDLLERFANRELGDTIYRVGCDLPRKLGPDDRLVPVIKFAAEHQLPFDNLLAVLFDGLYFAKADLKNNRLTGDILFQQIYLSEPESFLLNHCSFDPKKHHRVFELASVLYPFWKKI